jgi:hypothetical protein
LDYHLDKPFLEVKPLMFLKLGMLLSLRVRWPLWEKMS